jgi:antigen flippase
MSDFLRVTMLLGSVTAISLGVQVIRTKIVAMQVGKAGMALVAQLADWQLLLASLALLGAEQGVVALATDAWGRGDGAVVQRIREIVLRSIAPVTVPLLWILAAASAWIVPWVSGQSSHVLPVAIATVAVTLQLWIRPMQAVLNGARAFRLMARMRLLETVLGLLAVVPLVVGWGVSGAVWTLTSTQVCAFLATAWAWRRLERPAGTVTVNSAQDERRVLLRFGLMALITMSVGQIVGLVARRRIIALLGLEQAGLYQVAHALTLQYLGIVLQAMSAHSFPAYRSAAHDSQALEREVNVTLRGAVLVVTPVICTLLLLREVIVHALFSRDFSGATSLMQVQLLGDLFKVVAWSLGLTCLAAGRVRLHLVLEVVLGSTWLCFLELGMRTWGGSAPPVAFLANQVLMVVVYTAVNVAVFRVRVSPQNAWLIVNSCLATGAVYASSVLPLGARGAITLVTLLLWARLNLKGSELRDGLGQILRRSSAK